MRRLLVVLLVVAGLGLLVRGAVPCGVLQDQPACWAALRPGPTRNAFELIDVGDEVHFASAGEFVLTTVAVDDEVDLVEWVGNAFSDRVQQIPRTTLFQDRAPQEVARENAAEMQESQVDALVAALRALGRDAEPRDAGAEVTYVHPDGPAARAGVRSGDVVVTVSGRSVRDAEQFREAVAAGEVGDEVDLRLRRDGEGELALTLTLAAAGGRGGVPSAGLDVQTEVVAPIDVDIDAGRIGGPSAGLMFALTVVDLLGEEDLTGGRVVAGTGIIDRQGDVTAIGGIRQKILGAVERRDGEPASVFLVPAGNLETARTTPLGREVLLVPVGSLDDALRALEDLRADRRPEDALALGAS